ncbi:MAG: GNAT family N-acetyltransferase [Bacillota bacterium]
MRYFKKVEGERIYLSPINPDDAEKYTEWFNDLELTVNLLQSNMLISPGKEKEILEKLSKEGYNFAIVEKENDRLLGNCSLMDVDHVHRTSELGIFIGDKDYHSKGYGTEALNLLLDYAFNILNLKNVMLKVHAFNKRAVKCYRKVGFKVIGKRRSAFEIAGKRHDEILMDILKEEFEGRLSRLVD